MKSPKQKSLGQIAYEEQTKGDRHISNDGPWENVNFEVRHLWENVGRAVSTAVRARQKRKK